MRTHGDRWKAALGFEECISGGATSSCMRAMRNEGVELSSATEGTSLLPSYLDDPPARVAWVEHAVLTDRFADSVGGAAALEAVFEREAREAIPFLARVAGALADPVDLYRLLDLVFIPSLYPVLVIQLHDGVGGCLVTEGHLPGHLRPSRAFMHAMVGLHRGAPRMIGLPSASVEAEVAERSVRMRITPPQPKHALKHPELAAFVCERAAEWSLTPRQREVLAGVAEGLTNKELCVRLSCSLPTVETHVSAVLRKAGVMSRGELMAALWSGVRGTRRV